MTTKVTLPRNEMMAAARRAQAERRDVRIFEQENTTRGRIIRVLRGRHILITR